MTSFPSYTFKSDAGQASQVPRTLPVRVTEPFINVKEFGATGNGITDDTAAIGSAIAYAVTIGQIRRGAIVYFPPGTYMILTPPLFLDVDRWALPGTPGLALSYMGAGYGVSIIKGNYPSSQVYYENQPNGFLCQHEGAQRGGTHAPSPPVCSITDLTIWNDSTLPQSGALNIDTGGNNFYIARCHLHGFNAGSFCKNEFNSSVRDCYFTCSAPITSANAATLAPVFTKNKFLGAAAFTPPPPNSNYTGSVGLFCGWNSVHNNIIIGFDIGAAIGQACVNFKGNYISRCGVGIIYGPQPGTPYRDNNVGNPSPIVAFWEGGENAGVISNVIERCTFGIYDGPSAGIACANVVTGARSGANANSAPFDPVPLTAGSISWDNTTHVVTVTSNNHHVANGSVLQLAYTLSGGSNPWTTSPLDIVTVTGVTTNTFTYAGPSIAPSTWSSGSWNYASRYAAVVKPTLGFFAANSLEAETQRSFAIAALDNNEVIVNYPNAGSGTFTYVSSFWATRGSRGWYNSNITNNGGNDIRMCGMAGTVTISGSFESDGANPSQWSFFTSLPGQVNGQPTIATDWEANIIDGQKSGGGTAAFRDVVAGGGTVTSTNYYKIRYDGTNWIRIG